jgi:hypothetical protein
MRVASCPSVYPALTGVDRDSPCARTTAAEMKDWLPAAYDAAFYIEKLIEADGWLKSSVYNPSSQTEAAPRAVRENYSH